MDVEVVGGGCWWESGGEESAYEVVAAACTERERARESNQAGAIRQKQKRVQAAGLPLTPEAPAFASVTDNTDNHNAARGKRYNSLLKANAV